MAEATKYLAYDLKGIQKYIFAVPKLRYIVGGSMLISEFDEESHGIHEGSIKLVYAGGGRGLFQGTEAELTKLHHDLIERAHKIGLDIRLSEVSDQPGARADDLYPYRPDLLPDVENTEPCPLSGLWPVKKGEKVHPIIKLRDNQQLHRNSDYAMLTFLRQYGLDPKLEDQFAEALGIPVCDLQYRFLQDVQEKSENIDSEILGSRNRWAVICMDGNDMGRQGTKFRKSEPSNEVSNKWYTAFSHSLAVCTRESFYSALSEILNHWMRDILKDKANLQKWFSNGEIVFPFRPLILGGDDVTLVCHTSYAMDFVKAMIYAFDQKSKELAKKALEEDKIDLWPATNGRLSISAGVLYCKTSFPLNMGINYAEQLLKNAKSEFRSKDKNATEPTMPAVDWDAITDSFVDSPAERRRREMWFKDGETGKEIHLTQKPYAIPPKDRPAPDKRLTLDELVQQFEKVLSNEKNSFLSTLLPGLRQTWSNRVLYLASIGKNHSEIQKNLWEVDGVDKLGKWWIPDKDNDNIQQTPIIDALTLLKEERRMDQEAK